MLTLILTLRAWVYGYWLVISFSALYELVCKNVIECWQFDYSKKKKVRMCESTWSEIGHIFCYGYYLICLHHWHEIVSNKNTLRINKYIKEKSLNYNLQSNILFPCNQFKMTFMFSSFLTLRENIIFIGWIDYNSNVVQLFFIPPLKSSFYSLYDVCFFDMRSHWYGLGNFIHVSLRIMNL